MIASLLVMAPVMADQSQQPQLGGQKASTEFSNAFTRIEQSVQNSAESAQRNLLQPSGGRPAGLGITLLSVLAAITLFWQMGSQVLEGGEFIEYAGNYIRTVFLIAFAFWMMPGTNGQGAILNFVQSLTSDVAAAISGTDGGLSAIVGSALSSFFKSFATVGDQIGKVMADGVQEAHSSLPDGIVAFAVFFANIPAMMFLIAAALILLVSAVIYFLMAVVGTFMVAIAIILAPLFIPFLVLHATSWLFDGWLRFLIAACLYKVVGAAIMTLGNGVLANTTQDISNATWAGLFVNSILTAAISAALAYMMLQLTSIAQGLLNGNGALSMGRMMSRMSKGAQLAGAAGMATGGSTLKGVGAV
ncbi:MAG: type IV secretion system protein, partial [Georgfuchsia sp.]